MAVPFRALDVLDVAFQLPQLDAVAPDAIAAKLDAEADALTYATVAAIGDAFDGLRAALEAIDRFTQKNLHVRLDHALADEPVQPQLRTLLTSTVTSYARDLPLLAQRVGAALQRATPRTATAATARVVAAAETVLTLRAALQSHVFATAARLAAAWLPSIATTLRDPMVGTAERADWGRTRVELERIAANAGHILSGVSFADRLAKTEAPPEEPRPESTAERFSLLEVD